MAEEEFDPQTGLVADVEPEVDWAIREATEEEIAELSKEACVDSEESGLADDADVPAEEAST